MSTKLDMARPRQRGVRYVGDNGRAIHRGGCLLMAGKRPLAGHDLSDFGLLRHLERVVYLNAEVTHCTFKFRMA